MSFSFILLFVTLWKTASYSRQRNKLHLTISGGSKAREPWTLKSGVGGSSLGALQKFTPMLLLMY